MQNANNVTARAISDSGCAGRWAEQKKPEKLRGPAAIGMEPGTAIDLDDEGPHFRRD